MAGLKLPDGPHCNTCVLRNSGRGFLTVDGKGSNGVMLVGEALGFNEALTGKPFVGPAGFLLRKVLKRHVKAERDDFWIANTLFCRPPGNKLQGMSYKYAAIEQCRPYLDEAISIHQPRAIVALGDIAMERLTGRRGIEQCQNYAFREDAYNTWVVPALHPSFIQRGNNKYQPILGHAIRKAISIAEHGYEYEIPHTIQHPTVSDMEHWLRGYLKALQQDPTIPLAFDIETNYKGARDEGLLKQDSDPTYDILQISFAYGPDEGISLEWNEILKPLIRQALGTDGTKIVWNRSYDVPRIIANGVPIRGNIRDSMIAWHALQSDLNKGLGFVTPLIPGNERIPMWKHLSSEEGGWFYSAMDSIMLWRNDRGIMRSLEQEGILPFYQQYVEQVRPVLDDMERAGVLVDTEAQQRFIVEMEAQLTELESSMQDLVPEDLRDIEPKAGYKRDPEDTTGMRQIAVLNQEWRECPTCGLKNPPKTHFKRYKAKAHLHKNTACSGMDAVPMKGTEHRWARVMPFKPSPVQLIRYAAKKRYTVKKNYKTGNLTMNEETIEGLLKKHPNEPLFPLVLAHRSAQKLFGLYGPDGLLIGEDGRVHTHFSDNPSTFRFASYGPNMQNIPRDSEIRDLFVASEGCTLGARDFSGIEAVLVGYFSGDKDYTRLAKMGVHDYFNAHIAHQRGDIDRQDIPDLSWSDADLAAYLQELKNDTLLKRTRPIAKMGVHMSNYIGTPLRMYQAAPKLFGNVAGAETVQGLYFDVFPAIRQWQRHTCEQAERQGYVRSPYGVPHRFYQVYNYKKDPDTNAWVKILGADAKRCVAYNPQHTAAVIMRRAIWRLGQDPTIRPYLRLTIHDELLWECPTAEHQRVDATIKSIMEEPQPELKLEPSWGMGEYLSIGTEGKFGKRWGSMHG